MQIYDRPTKVLMHEFAKSELKPGQIFGKAEAVRWFASRYPKTSRATVELHVEGMAINTGLRNSHPNIRPGSGHDLFLKVGRGQFRLWDPTHDPTPRYAGHTVPREADDVAEEEDLEDSCEAARFAAERDLQNYLSKNMSTLEPGLRLYEDEEFSGVEYPAGGGRRIDLLAIAQDQAFVVVELKVSRGYDRVVGQLLRYIAWVKANVANGRPVRGIIVASQITDDLKLAASSLTDVKLVEYELSFKLSPVT